VPRYGRHVIKYRDVLVERAKRAPSERAIARLASAAGGPIPEALIRFTAKAVDVAVPYAVFLGDRPFQFGFEPFASLEDEIDSFAVAWFRDQLPRAMLPIGRTGGEDDTLLLDLGSGAVLAWISGRPAPGRENDVLHEVASDFDAYLDRLVLFESDLEDCDLLSNRVVRAYVAERGPEQAFVVGGVDWGMGWKASRG